MMIEKPYLRCAACVEVVSSSYQDLANQGWRGCLCLCVFLMLFVVGAMYDVFILSFSACLFCFAICQGSRNSILPAAGNW